MQNLDDIVEALAKDIHESNREVVAQHKTIIDLNLPFASWDEISPDAREGRRMAARFLLQRWYINEPGNYTNGDDRYIDNIDKFREQGYLQEVNRQFFNPLGLALQVGLCDHKDHYPEICTWPNGYWIGILDFQKDPEGILFSGSDIEENRQDYLDKINSIEKLRMARIADRILFAVDHKLTVDFNGVQIIPTELLDLKDD